MGPLEIAKKPKRQAGDLLREARVTYGISQGELATRANTTQSAISRIEAGKVSPSFETVRELLRLLGQDLIIDVALRDPAFSAPADEGEDRASFGAGPLLDALDRKGVDFVVIGGQAGRVFGSAIPTDDLDIAYAHGARNLERLAGALRGIGAKPYDAPADQPFRVDARTLAPGIKLTFDTELGDLDLIGEVDSIRRYDELRAGAEVREVGGVPARVASLDHLIRMKRLVDRADAQRQVEEYVAIERLHREWKKRQEAD
jgi:transcriptional regulator with XRE-family HTH domain